MLLRLRSAGAAKSAAAAVAAALLASAATGNPILSRDSIPGPSASLDERTRAAARSLGAAAAAIDRGDLPTAQVSLARAGAASALSDYVDYFEARLLLESGHAGEAETAARRGADTHAGSPLVASFNKLLGDARLAGGNESGARTAWETALSDTQSRKRQETLRIAILESHERTGTLQTALAEREGEDTLVAVDRLPPELSQALDSPRARLDRADDLRSRGRCEAALAEYRRARSGGLDGKRERHARLQMGHCQFRLRRYALAEVEFESLLPDPEARFWRARSIARSGRTRKATVELAAIGESGNPSYASWARYLAATLLEDRGEQDRAMALYEQVAAANDDATRTRSALWRLGWSSFNRGQYANARARFQALAKKSETLDALRPRYWAARSAALAGKHAQGRRELVDLATHYPLSYYGWRATDRLGDRAPRTATAAKRRVPRGTSAVRSDEIERVELLLEAGLSDHAQQELDAIARRARGLDDRTALGRLYVLSGDYHRAQRLVVDAYEESLSRGLERGSEALWWLSWPPAYAQIVDEVFPDRAVIDRALVWAIMREESSYRPGIQSSAGARGLLQIMPETGAQVARKTGVRNFDPEDLFVPRVNIRLGAAYLDELGRRFDGRLSAAIGSYNAGPRAVSGWLRGDRGRLEDDVWVENIPYDQTRSYVKRVLRSLYVYRTFYDTPQTATAAPAS